MLLTQRAQEIIAHAAPRAAARIVELMDGNSEHVAGKMALRVAESEGVIQPVGGPGVHVNVNTGFSGYAINWTGLPWDEAINHPDTLVEGPEWSPMLRPRPGSALDRSGYKEQTQAPDHLSVGFAPHTSGKQGDGDND